MMALTNIHYVILCICLWTTLTHNAESFILDANTCLALQPCTCEGSNVLCSFKNLSIFPKFEISNVSGRRIQMDIQNNKLTTIPTNAFCNLTVPNTTTITLFLYNNHINSIATNAFAGIAGSVTYLDLDNNNLTAVPAEFTSLSKLKYLSLVNNPISSISSNIMYALRRNLQSLSISLNNFNTLPTELDRLSSLTSLDLTYLNVNNLDYDALDSFENTLLTLSIRSSQLEKIPVAVCHLHNLHDLMFYANPNLHTNSTIFEPCNTNLNSVSNVDLNNNRLRYMPNIFQSFPSIRTLSIYSNELSYIDWDIIPDGLPLQDLYAYNNDFTRIPTAINKLHDLRTLYIHSNKITSLEDYDLFGLSKLDMLLLDYNPIEYISPNAFKNNPALNFLSIKDTNLRHLPTSMAGLHNLQRLSLLGSPIECTCHLSFLNALDVSGIDIDGNCTSIPSQIKTYLTDDLPNCH